ncbi:GIY-YIG nuclease family protein [Streptomyces sp. enrichment culture]|uniref:GIY-YIG nuclease family protein n=1 Tax=Streptomyces sp. enrichment culture TaxID=1795815 RepID=UPI003F56C997
MRSDDTAKIGFSRNLAHRFQALHRQSGSPVQPVAIMPGGRTLEALMHWRFREHWTGEGEFFHPVSELVTFAVEQGIPAEFYADVASYYHWASTYAEQAEDRTARLAKREELLNREPLGRLVF